MRYNSAAVAAATFASLTLAAPTPTAQDGQSGSVDAFSIDQVAVPLGYAKNGARAYAKALKKYQQPVPDHVVKAAAAATQTGTVGANPQANDEAYLSPVQIGTTNPVTLNLDFDTGSSDLWVFSSEQSASQRSGHSYYTTSSGKQEAGETWKISYGDGSGASGNVFADKVVIGGVTATSQAVEAATSVSSSFSQDTDTDGLVGLAFSSINTVTPNRVTTFFDTVKASLKAPLFAAYLKHNAVGAYDFGAINPNHYSGTIGYVNVNTANGFWQFTAGTAYAGTTSLGSVGSAIADTGTSLILVSDAIVRAYYSRVSGAQNSASYGGYVFPCSATLPDFAINIAGANRVVPGSYINYAPISGSTCYGGIQSSAGIGFNILGDVFLKSQYVVFNGASTPQLGFATTK